MIRRNKKLSAGFSIIEILIVIAIIGVLSAVIMPMIGSAREKATYVKAKAEFRSIETALEDYKTDHAGAYPDDVGREIPPGLEKYLSSGNWSSAAWPGSTFDWDTWYDYDADERVYQISIRFCPAGTDDDEIEEKCHFPKADWAVGFDQNSAVYYCLQGACRSHVSEPADHPGKCVNCGEE